MPWRTPRKLLFICAALDFAAINGSVALSNAHHQINLPHPQLQIGVIGATYCLLGWLLGSYTVLRWPWLRLRLVLQRLAFTAIASLTVLVVIKWILGLNPSDYSLLNRGILLEVMFWQSLFALFIRLGMRLINRLTPQARWRLMAHPEHLQEVIREWQRNPFIRPPQLISGEWLQDSDPPKLVNTQRPFAVAVSESLELDTRHQGLIKQLRSRGVLVTSLQDLAERQLERLPPSLLPKDWLDVTDAPWMNEFSLQRKVKRFADLIVSCILLALCFPLILLASLAVWIEDRGPVLYIQTRSGWMGRPFQLLKLRTMRTTESHSPTPWTSKKDKRITVVGNILRKTRLDELPQLINVIKGEMSLIGPRPEQLHIDEELASLIPHYRKRYWMLPGLSGWAQVCGPAYPASIEESELKLSYDLFYIRHWSLSLDSLILAKTMKTLLKLRGV